MSDKPFTPEGVWVEGPTLLKVDGRHLVYYDEYTNNLYGAMATTDVEHWTDVSVHVRFPDGTRHGTAFQVSESVLESLLSLPEART